MKCTTEFGVYVKGGRTDLLLVCLYVDDLLVTGSNESGIAAFKKEMMTDLGHLAYFLGIEFKKVESGMVMHQAKYATDLLKRFHMFKCNPAATLAETGSVLEKEGAEEEVDATQYRQIVGSLRYLCNTRPNISYSVGVISRFMERPRMPHLLAAKRIMRYVKGTLEFGLVFPNMKGEQEVELMGYSNADWCGDKNDRKSTAGYFFRFGEAPISWCSKKESIVALSSCEAEYVAASMSACQALWIDSLLQEMKVKEEGVVKLLVDNKSAINLAKHPIAHGRSKHIEARFHFLRDQVSRGKLKLEFCKSECQVADILTKPMKKDRFDKLRSDLGVVNLMELN